MSFQPKPNSGALFRLPDDKRPSETSPEYEGELTIDCPHCQAQARGWVKAWIRTTKTGGKFFSLAFKWRQASAPRQDEAHP
jgi:hypothetical protein